ncbi:LON peptidase substrate-binding domain-containing protein [Ktedonospora formicarum]|uniref:ATP-dependent protease n=1 Tax=Ktedonospora formicarum TaxID=2778364 RepID=A0A8J3HSU1_9CHLR|nr:LON peptidase substrate-binding domain-containing protein [Ktedonospora formicarum]GHO43064.1 ATP-dependent protease [Ktedonospora formicarum]
MASITIELPLFPLDVVLFPGTVLPLHVFEPRYRQMVTDCQHTQKPFGIVLAKPGSVYQHEVPYSIGTMAQLHNVERLDDGRYTLMAVGTRRFRIRSQHRQKPYLSGLVEPFGDQPEPIQALKLPMARACGLFRNYLEMLLEAVNEDSSYADLPEDPEDLSYFIAYFLEIQNDIKQCLLEMTSTQERLHDEIDILRREIPFMRQILSKNLPEGKSMLN